MAIRANVHINCIGAKIKGRVWGTTECSGSPAHPPGVSRNFLVPLLEGLILL